MILNEKTVQNKILRRELIQQLVKLKQKITTIPQQYQQIQYLTHQIKFQQFNLQDIKNKLKTKKSQVSSLKYQLLIDLEKIKAQKQKEFQNARLQMKQLNQNCFQIRKKKQNVRDVSKLQTKLNNKLKEISINSEEGENRILAFQVLRIEKLNQQVQLLQLMKEKQKFIDGQKLEKQKQTNIVSILNQSLLEMQSKVSTLNYENTQLEISEALLQNELEVVSIEMQKLNEQNRKKKLNIFQIEAKIAKNQRKISEEQERISKNNLNSEQLKNKVQKSFMQMREINEKIIKTRSLVIHLNRSRNVQKKLNQELKLKVKQLMEITLQMTKVPPQL